MGTSYEPMSLARLATHLVSADTDQTRWKLVWEFLEEYRWEPAETRVDLLSDEPGLILQRRVVTYGGSSRLR
ncbi:hypothetical protein ACFY2R_28965 [Micromonospora olivasterospora]|uniref:Uncharacterized protein n=1 Tax=Micromonospora olivasterospora TaxID=1880 RepID=A0A562I309_MICOL|nr:hypothetical protein JD77_00278 [Micromonospora olivasterospora]